MSVSDIGGQENPLAVGLAVDRTQGPDLCHPQRVRLGHDGQGKRLWQFGEKPKNERRTSFYESPKQKPEDEPKEVAVTAKHFSPEFAFDDKFVYLGGDDGRVYSVDAVTGARKWAFTGLRAMGSPALAEGTLFCGSKDGWMYALNPQDGATEMEGAGELLRGRQTGAL